MDMVCHLVYVSIPRIRFSTLEPLPFLIHLLQQGRRTGLVRPSPYVLCQAPLRRADPRVACPSSCSSVKTQTRKKRTWLVRVKSLNTLPTLHS